MNIAFAYTTLYIDFDTMEDLYKYKKKNMYKGWRFKDEYINGDFFTLIVERPYKDYNTGW